MTYEEAQTLSEGKLGKVLALGALGAGALMGAHKLDQKIAYENRPAMVKQMEALEVPSKKILKDGIMKIYNSNKEIRMKARGIACDHTDGRYSPEPNLSEIAEAAQKLLKKGESTEDCNKIIKMYQVYADKRIEK